MREESSPDRNATVERLMAQLRSFKRGLDLDEVKIRQIVRQIIIDMPLHTDEERLEWARHWMRAASGE